MNEQFEMIAKTFQGLEEILAEELTALGANDIQIGRRMVSFTGDKRMMYKANFCLRTAIRILKPIKNFTAKDADEVYNEIQAIPWEEYLDVNKTFAIDAVVFSEEFRHSKFVSYKVKDAIVDYFREKTGKRPSVPLNEVLAAGMILMTGWRGECDLIDPMCGSGTIPVEAALIARNIAPGVFRKGFAFEKWVDFDADMFDELYNDDSQEREFTHKIYGYDNNPKANEIATHNIKAAGVSKDVVLKLQPFQQFEQPKEKSVIITNPPYGERISTNDLLGLYQMIGERLKHAFVGNEAWVLSYREECFDQIGLKASQKVPLFNGPLECEFRKYEIFDGKYKEFKSQEEAGEEKKETEGEQASKFRERKEYKPRREGEFKPRRESEFRPRREGDSRPRREGEYKPRREEGEFKREGNRERKPQGEFRSRRDPKAPREFKGNREPRIPKKEEE